MKIVAAIFVVLGFTRANLFEDLHRERRDVKEQLLTIRDLTKRSTNPHPNQLHLELRSADGETENLVLKRNIHFNDHVPVETSHNGVRKRHITEPLDAAEYLSKRAAFHVTSEWTGSRYRRSITGFLQKRDGKYLVERDAFRQKENGHKMTLIESPPIEESVDRVGMKLHDAIQPPTNRTGFRRGRTYPQSTNVVPDILLVIDYGIYTKMGRKYRHLSRREQERKTIQRIKDFYGILWAGVAQKYEQVNYQGITISPRMAQILILKSEADDRRILGDVKDRPRSHNNRGELNADLGLENAAHWFAGKKRRRQFPDIDHCMVITHHVMYTIDNNERNYGVVGLAYLEQICEYWQSSIVEDEFSMQAVGTAAHELAHNLGADHDNERRCQDDYQMSPWVTDGKDHNFENQYKFSPCSLEQFKEDIDDLNRRRINCMADSPRLGDEVYDIQYVVPGSRMSLDQQCEMFTGKPGAKYCGSEQGACRKLKCQEDGYQCRKYNNRHALHGTPCGRDMECRNGACVRANRRG